MSGRQSRIARKAAHVEKTEIDREFNAGLGALRRERDAALHTAGKHYHDGIAKLQEERNNARAQADARYEEGRAKLLKRLAAKEAA